MKKETKYFIAWCAGWIVAFVVLLLMFSCSGTTKIEKEYVHDTTIVEVHDTTRDVEILHDSVDRWHTHYEYVKGDTVYKVDSVLVDRWHTKVDTSQHSKIEYVDRVKVEYRDRNVVKVEERKVYVWCPLLVAAVLIAAGYVYKLVRRK